MVRSKSKKQQDPEMRLINAAMILAARRRWRDINMADIASEAKIPVADALSHSRSKAAILGALGRHIDRVVLNDLHTDPDIGDSPKDRLFELMMRRFDAMADYRSGLASVSADMDFSLFAALRRVCHIQNAMALTLEAAGVSATGPCGFLRQQGLGAIYIYCLSVWFNDETDDMSATMAALDRALTVADNLIVRRFGHGSSETGSDTSLAH